MKTTELWIMLLYDGIGTHALLEKRKGKRKNIGLDFPIIFENWLNLWKNKLWKLVEAQLHTWYALYSAFCVWCFCIQFCCCRCLFIFPFFSAVGFPFHRQFFFPILHLLFFGLFYTLDFVTYIFETHSFFFTQISLPSIQNGTYVMCGTYIEPTLLHFCLVACYYATLSKTVNPFAEKPLSSVV